MSFPLPFSTLLATKTVLFYQDTDTITITRQAPQPNGTTITSTIFSGYGDYQESSGQLYFDPAGAQLVADAIVYLNPADAPLPDLLVGDYATIVQSRNGAAKPVRAPDGTTAVFTVVAVMEYTSSPPHLEITLKRGIISYQGGAK